MVTTSIDVFKLVTIDKPLEGFDVIGGLADLKHQVNVRATQEELGKPRFLVILVKLLEVVREDFVRQQIERFTVKSVIAKRLDGEDIGHLCLGLQPDVNVVAKNKSFAERDHVLGNTVVVRCDPFRGEEFGFDGAKDIAARIVKLFQTLAKVRGMLPEPISNNLVRATFELNVGGRIRFGSFGGDGFGHGVRLGA